jgi:hypothetical protein
MLHTYLDIDIPARPICHCYQIHYMIPHSYYVNTPHPFFFLFLVVSFARLHVESMAGCNLFIPFPRLSFFWLELPMPS